MEITITNLSVVCLLILGIILIVSTTILAGVLVSRAIHSKEKFETEEGVVLFNERVHTQDYLSFINSCVSYLLSYGYLHLDDFISSNVLRSATNDDFTLLEETINAYPIVSCKYLGNYKFELQREAMIQKYEVYQEESGRDEYIVPLFDNDVVQKYKTLFNFETRYQQFKIVDRIMHHARIEHSFNKRDQMFVKIRRKASIST